MDFFKNLFSWFNLKSNRPKTGFIKFFNRKRGFGFIQSVETEDDVFVHITELEDKVSQGDFVKFRIAKSEKGLQATNVELVEMDS